MWCDMIVNDMSSYDMMGYDWYDMMWLEIKSCLLEEYIWLL